MLVSSECYLEYKLAVSNFEIATLDPRMKEKIAVLVKHLLVTGRAVSEKKETPEAMTTQITL
jgi:hypothetical protein